VFINELVANGNVLIVQRELDLYIWGFDEHLYLVELENEEVCATQAKIFAFVPKMVTKAMNRELIKEITIEELKEVVNVLLGGKAPKHNVFPTKFFQNTFEETRGDLVEAFKAMLNLGQLLDFFNRGLIVLILKYGDCSKIGN